MTFLQIINLIKETALAQPNVNTFVRNFLDLNREDTVYSAVVLQDRDGNRDRISEQDWNTYSFHLGFVDRLTYDESNRDDIFSTGINIINNIVASIRNTWFPDVEVNIIDRFQTFDQRFTASCAGVYVVLAIQVPISECVDGEQTDLYDKYEATFIENGHYHFVPSGRPIDEIDITIDCPEPKPEERLVETISANGSYHYAPTTGSVFSEADIAVDVHPTRDLYDVVTSNGEFQWPGEWKSVKIAVEVHPSNKLVETITSNGTTSFSGEWKNADITVDVHPSNSLSETYTTNGTKAITGEFNGGSVVVDVHPSGSLVESITSNGSYHYNGEWSGADITVAVSGGGQKPEESLIQVISANGSYHYDPTPGSVFSGADISVDVHPSNTLSRTYTTNGTKTITGEFNGGTININVHPSASLSEIYTSNGSYNISGEFNGGTVTVSVSDTVENMFANCGSYDKVFYYNGDDGGNYTAIISELPSGWTAVDIRGGSGDTNIIYYTSSDNQIVIPYDSSAFGNASIVSNTYNNGFGTIIFNNPVTIIDVGAFQGCSTLASIVIPSTVRKIDFDSFQNCIGLTSIYIPANVDTISTPFIGCYNLTSIVVDPDNENYDSRNNCNAIIWDDDVFHQRNLVQGCANTVIPSTVVVIGENSFNGMITLTSITIPSSVTNIRQSAFRDCTGLIEVIVNATTPPSLGSNVFTNNASGRLIKVPATSLQDYLNAPGWSDYASQIVSQ